MLNTIYKHWLGYKISNNRSLLNKAHHSAFTEFKQNPGDLRLYFWCAFINIEKGELDRAKEFIDNITPYKAYYKNNEPLSFAYYLFLSSLFELRCGKHRPARKYYRQLEEYSVGRDRSLYDLLLGGLKLECMEYDASYEFLKNAFARGCRTPYLYICLNDYYLNKPDFETGSIFASFLKWSIVHGISVGDIIINDSAKAYIKHSPAICHKLYSTYPLDFILETICDYLIAAGDYSEKAYFFYKEALTKQIFKTEINNALIQAAYKNGIEDVGRYSLLRFLEFEPTHDIKPYIYHLMLTNKKLREFLPTLKNEILQFTLYSLENNLRGRYYNSLYKFLIEVSYEQEIKKEYLSKAEIFLISDLFCYEIKLIESSAKYIWIQEKEKKGMKIFEITGEVTKIRALSEHFTYYCFGDKQKKITVSDINITKIIENSDLRLCQHFYKRKLLSTELLITLSKHYLSLEKPAEESLDIFEKTLAETEISYSFKMTLLAAMGSCYYSRGSYDKAVEYYLGVDINCLNGFYVEQALLVFLNAQKHDKAVDVLVKKSMSITDKSLFYAIKQLNDEKYYPLVADVAYDLLLKSWYDKHLLKIVLKYYTTSRKELQELSFSLSRMSIFENEIDEIILNTSIYTHEFDVGSQKTFVKLYHKHPQNKFVQDYAYYCVYEIIVNSKKPEYETLEVLENMFDETNDHFLGYALCHLYLGQGIVTLISDKIILKSVLHLEEDEILFPVYKLIKDKAILSPYIEKNQPFIYRTLPNKEVYLLYRTDEETEYREKKMTYRRFGIYSTTLMHFYGDKIKYCFSEKIQTGSIMSGESTVHNTRLNLQENVNDPYYTLNNALIYEQMFKYDMVESIISERLKDTAEIRGRIL